MRNVTLPREFYVPEQARGQEPVRPEGTDLEIWLYDVVDRPYAVAFQGKARKPLWHHRFRSSEARAERIAATAEVRKEVLAAKAESAARAREYTHTYKVGDVLVASWGYDQTNVNFYEVVRVVSPKMIEIRAINGRIEREERGADYVVPVPGTFHGEVMRRRVTKGERVTTEADYRHAHRWDGRACYETALGWGH